MNERKQHLVKDYMQRQVATISQAGTLKDAIFHMVRSKTNGLVVVDESKKIVGILSTMDIIAFIVPDYLEEDKHLAAFEAETLFEQRVKTLANEPISKFMTTPVHTIKTSHSLTEAAALCAEFRIRQLPVVDDSGALAGYITRTNIKQAIAEILEIPWIIEA